MTDRPTNVPGDAEGREDSGGLLPALSSPGAAKRKAIAPHMLVTVAILQAVDGGLRCPLCTLRITTNHKRVLEHLTPLAFGGTNTIDNLRWVHKECADLKTNGNKATCADGDLHKIGKAKRGRKEHDLHKAVMAGDAERPPSRIKSRGFDRSFRKRMNGTVTKRESV